MGMLHATSELRHESIRQNMSASCLEGAIYVNDEYSGLYHRSIRGVQWCVRAVAWALQGCNMVEEHQGCTMVR